MAANSFKEQLQQQNEVMVDVKEGINSLNASFINFFNAEKTRKEKERLKDSEERQDKTGFFGKMKERLSSSGKGKKSNGLFKSLGFGAGIGGVAAVLGGLASKLLTRSSLALGGLLLADVVGDYITKSFDSVEAGDISQRIMKGASLGLLFGKKGLIIGAILGAFNTEEVRTELAKFGTFLKESGIGPAIQEFVGTTLVKALKGLNALTNLDFGGFFDNIGSVTLAIGGLFLAFAPFKTLGLLTKITGLQKLFSVLVGGIKSLLAIGVTKLMSALRLSPVSPVGPQMPAKTSVARGLSGLASKAVSGVTKTARAGLLAGSLGLGVLTNGRAAGITSKVASGVAGLASKAASTAGAAGAATAGVAGAAKGAAGKLATKAGASTVLKAVPGLGALVGIGFGLNALRKGDVAAAGLHVASGLAASIPGFGTAASVALSTAAVAKEEGLMDDIGKKNPTTASEIKEGVDKQQESERMAVAMNNQQIITDNSVKSESSSLFGFSSDTFDRRDPTLYMRGMAT